MGGSGDAAQRSRGAAEEAAEAGCEMAVAGKPGIERDRGEIVAAVEHGIQRMRQPFMQDIVVDRGADAVAKYVAEMERRQVRDLGEPRDIPFSRRRKCYGFLDAFQRARPPG